MPAEYIRRSRRVCSFRSKTTSYITAAAETSKNSHMIQMLLFQSFVPTVSSVRWIWTRTSGTISSPAIRSFHPLSMPRKR